MRTILTALAFTVLLVGTASAERVRIATWNIEHLRAENGTGSVAREDIDYEALSALATELDADVIALQEVDGPEAAARVFDPSVYAFFFSDRRHPQRTGFAVRRGITVTSDLDYVALELDGSVRRGTDITIEVGGQALRLLSVHLKSSCFQGDLDRNRHCRTLRQQVPVVETWIDQRTTETVPFVVLGDFNWRFDSDGDVIMPDWNDGDPVGLVLSRVTQGLRSGCLGGRYPDYIDHIILDEQAAAWLVPDSFHQVDITEADEDRFKLSDHCPIAVDLEIGSSSEDPAARARDLFEEIRRLVRETNEKMTELEGLIPLLQR